MLLVVPLSLTDPRVQVGRQLSSQLRSNFLPLPHLIQLGQVCLAGDRDRTAGLQRGSTEAERAPPGDRKDNLWKDRPFAAEISATSPILKGDSEDDKGPLKDMNPRED